jgi:hypothetical protein
VTSVTEKFSGPNDIVIYPNPVTDYINIIINGNKTEELTIIIIDITGSIASKSKKNIHAGIDHLKINTQGLHKGFYLLKIPELNIIKGMILK